MPGVGSNAPASIGRKRPFDPPAHLVGVAHRVALFLAAREVAVGERQVLGPLVPDLDTGEPVELELQRVGRAGARLPVDDLPGPVRLAEDRVDPPAHGERADPQQERALGVQRRDVGEPRRKERLAQPLDPARVAGKLLLGEVDDVVGLEQASLTGRAAFDPPVDLGADPRRRSAESRQRPHPRPVEALGAQGMIHE